MTNDGCDDTVAAPAPGTVDLVRDPCGNGVARDGSELSGPALATGTARPRLVPDPTRYPAVGGRAPPSRGSGAVPVGRLVFKTSGAAPGVARWVRLPCAPATRPAGAASGVCRSQSAKGMRIAITEPATPFSAESIRAGLPAPERFGCRDLRWCRA